MTTRWQDALLDLSNALRNMEDENNRLKSIFRDIVAVIHMKRRYLTGEEAAGELSRQEAAELEMLHKIYRLAEEGVRG